MIRRFLRTVLMVFYYLVLFVVWCVLGIFIWLLEKARALIGTSSAKTDKAVGFHHDHDDAMSKAGVVAFKSVRCLPHGTRLMEQISSDDVWWSREIVVAPMLHAANQEKLAEVEASLREIIRKEEQKQAE